MIRLAALLCGLICSAGVIISGLFQPVVLQGLGNPAGIGIIAVGLLSALIVAALVLVLARRLSLLLPGATNEPPPMGPTAKTVAGGLLFGFGWGLAGYFPLAALVALGLFAPGAVIFLASVLGGMVLHDLVANRGRLGVGGLRSRG